MDADKGGIANGDKTHGLYLGERTLKFESFFSNSISLPHRFINPSKSSSPSPPYALRSISYFPMKFSIHSLLRSRPQAVCQNASKYFFTCTPSVPAAPVPSHSTADKLYRRLTPLGDPNISMVPVLDQWVREGRNVDQRELQDIVKEMQKYRRYKHALEISQWMTDRRYFPLAQSDIVMRLNLIYKVHGMEQAEEYFKNIPQKIKGFANYTALLNCYAKEKSVEKAESVMQKLRNMGITKRNLVAYNILLGLYYHLGDMEKLESLLHEMEEKDINGDIYTYTTCLSAYAAALNTNTIDTIMNKVESEPQIVKEWKLYSVAANAYRKVGLVDKSLEMLRKIEELTKTRNPLVRTAAYDFLLRLYGKIGRKDELYRIWNLYKEERILNRGYLGMISSVLMFDDIEGAKKILDEWESRGLSYDFKIPNCLIDAYVKDGHLEEAEAIVRRGIEKGGKPIFQTWLSLASGYIEDNRVGEAIEALKKAIPLCPPHPDPIKDILSTGLEYLEGGGGDAEEMEKCMRLLKEKEIFSATVLDKLCSFIKEKLPKK